MYDYATIGAMPRFHFVRHGRTTWNVEGRVQGGGNLDSLGVAQACALAARLAGAAFDAVYASPYPRTRQTACIVAGALGLPVSLHFLLRDLDYGHLAGARLDDFKAAYPQVWERWRAAPDRTTFPGGESLGGLRARILRFVERAGANGAGDVLAVTHDSPVRTAASIALGLPDSQHTSPSLSTPCASLTAINVDGGRWMLESHNDAAHLAGLDGLG